MAVASLSWLLESDGLRVESYHSAGEVLDEFDPDAPGCFITDVRMPDMNGLELQEELSRRGGRHPIIFVTGYGDVPTCSQAYRNGAFDFFEKPVNEQLLLDQVHRRVNGRQQSPRATRRSPGPCDDDGVAYPP